MLRSLRDLLILVSLVVGALAFSQVPRFVQEYEQRLGGALEEARRQHAELAAVASRAGLTVDDLADRLRASGDAALHGLAGVLERAEQRVQALEEQARALAEAGRLARPAVLAHQGDGVLFWATWERFEPSVTLDPGFAALGALVAAVLDLALWALWRLMRPIRGYRHKTREASGTS
jgi:hypothetical protein